MSQKEDENDYTHKNFYMPTATTTTTSTTNPPVNNMSQPQQATSQEQQKTQQIPAQTPLLPGGAAPQFMSHLPPSQMPPYYWDYYSSMYYPSMANPAAPPPQFDPNQMYPKPSSLLTPSSSNKPASAANKTNPTQSAAAPPFNPAMSAGASSYMPPPYMDPYMHMYMTHHHMYGYPPYQPGLLPPPPPSMIPPYGLGHHVNSSASISGGQRQLQEDQISLRSFNYDMDTRSEKRLNLNSSLRQPQPGVSTLAGFKQEPRDQRTLINRSGLLIEDPTSVQSNQLEAQQANNETLNMDPTSGGGMIESSMVKRDEIHRMTPQLHQLPHVRASFSLNGLVQIRANDPCEGQPALVDMINLGDLMEQYLNNTLRSLKDKTITLINDENDEDEDDEESSNEIRNQILNNYKWMQEFPGPLVKEHTSKAQVIQFCQKNVKQCLANTNLIDPQSHALLWDFLALLVRQNGLIDLKTDISPLLLTGIGADPLQQQQQQTQQTAPTPKQLSNSPSSSSLVGLQQSQDFVLVSNDGAALNQVESVQTAQQQQQQQQKQIQLDEEMHLNKLRQLLGAGQKSDAIEQAIKFNMWPHALFLASYSNGQQTDTKLLNKVKIRFINSLPPNDPIQTCYQLMTGRIPAVANNISKLDWNDWRRHLAMIVSNIDETNKDLVLNSIRTMGDSLASNGRVAASHFCYLLANCSFGTYEKKSSKLVLIGSSHNQDFSKFCQINAIQATEIYEFANALSSASTSGMLDHFVKYKLIYTTRLLEFGLINEASKYIEVIAKSINTNPKLHSTKISTVFQLAKRLKIFDSDFVLDDLNNGSSEPQWLQELSNNYKKFYLNKLWHLLPTDEPPAQQQQQQVQQQQYQPQLQNDNVLTAKNEPKTAEPSPVNQSNIIQNQQQTQYYDPQFQQQQQQQQAYQQYDIPDLGEDMNRLNLTIDNTNDTQPQVPQQSVPFYPTYSSTNIDNTNLTTGINYADQTQPQPAQLNQRRYEIDSQTQLYDSSNQQAPPPQQQQQNQSSVPPQFYNPHDYTNSNAPTSQSPSYLDANQQKFTFNSYNPSGGAVPQQQQHQTAPISQPPGRRSSNASAVAHTSNRSRQSSTSTSYDPSPYNLYQQHHHQSHQSLFDPNSTSQMPRSATYPVNAESNNNTQMTSHLSTNPIKEEPMSSSSNQVDSDDENEDRKDANGGKNQGANQSQGWLKRMFDSIRPATGPKKMVLPDDKKKSIVWDEKLGRYVNTEASEEQAAAVKPPPKFMPTTAPAVSSASSGAAAAGVSQESAQSSSNDQPTGMPPPLAAGANLYSLKSAGNKRSYYSKIDVMAGQTKKLTPPNMEQQFKPLLSTMPPPSQLPPRFFVPEPTNNTTSTTQQPSEQPQQDQSQIPQQQQQQQQQESQYPNYQANDQYNQQQQQQIYQPNFVPQSNYQNPEQQNLDYQYQPQYQQQSQPQYLMPENTSTEESTDSNTNSHESYNGSSQTSSSNDSNYIQQQQQYYQQYGYPYYPPSNSNSNQFYDPNQHSNI